jgi:RNA polymerase sigma-70 factor (ECF subfamily)
MAPFQTLNEQELIVFLRQGDERAFTEIYNRYWNKLTAIAYNLMRDKSAAKEIVQDLFVGIWNRREQIDISNLSGYLATATRFAIFKQIERERRRREIESRELGILDEAVMDQEIELKFLKEYLSGQLHFLPEKCRLVFDYSRIQDLSIPEIAEKMNISEKTVEGHLTKGLKLVRMNLRDGGILSVLIGTTLHQWLK